MLQDISGQQRILLPYMMQPDRSLHLLRPGRLVRVREGPNDWGWGIVLAVRKGLMANGMVRPFQVLLVESISGQTGKMLQNHFAKASSHLMSQKGQEKWGIPFEV